MSLAGQADPIPESSTSSSTGGPVTGLPRPRTHRVRTYALRLAVAAAVVAPVALVGGTASAAPTPTAAQLQAQIQKTQHEAEVATEQYNGAREQLTSVNVRVAAAKARQARQQQLVAQARRAVGQIAAETYRQGDLASLSLFLGNDPDGMLAESGLLATLGDRRAAAISHLVVAQAQLKQDSADLFQQQSRLMKTEASAAAAKKAAQAKNSAAKAQLARLNAAQVAALARSSRGDVRVGLKCSEVSIQAPNAQVQKVLDFACSHLGDPYRYGATGPSSFDCSGFTLRSWQAGGVTLPRTAAEQAGAGTRVSVSSLRPGDLIFFYSPISHVGIYLGNGLMIHSPHTGDVVSIASARVNQIVAATRP